MCCGDDTFFSTFFRNGFRLASGCAAVFLYTGVADLDPVGRIGILYRNMVSSFFYADDGLIALVGRNVLKIGVSTLFLGVGKLDVKGRIIGSSYREADSQVTVSRSSDFVIGYAVIVGTCAVEDFSSLQCTAVRIDRCGEGNGLGSSCTVGGSFKFYIVSACLFQLCKEGVFSFGAAQIFAGADSVAVCSGRCGVQRYSDILSDISFLPAGIARVPAF